MPCTQGTKVNHMGRPKKCRKVCQLPNTKEFLPVGTDDCTTAIVLTVDEFETLRLIDLQDLSQEECGANMQVARTTVQAIYGSARKKLAQALVEGRPIRIEGGDYQLCDGSGGVCGCRMGEEDARGEEGGAEKAEEMLCRKSCFHGMTLGICWAGKHCHARDAHDANR